VSEAEKQTPEKAPAYPGPVYAWSLIVFLTLAYISSFIDRYIIGLLVDPIKESTGASDTMMGFLSSAFNLTYALVALPIGLLIDRRSRTKIVAIGVFLWSLATVWTGMAKTMVQLFAARMSVGVGEAVLSPAAFSMIGDSFPKEKRGLPIAVYSMALILGSGLANIIASVILPWANSFEQIVLPVFGELEPWQFIFILVGLPGFILTIVFLLFREPPRIESSPREGASLGDAFVFIYRKGPTFFSFVSIFMCMVAIAYGGFFNAPLFSRTWGWAPEVYARYNGLSILVVSPLVYLFFGWLSDRGMAKGVKDRPLKIAIAGLLIMVPTAVAYPLMPDVWSAFTLNIVCNVGIGMVSVTGVNALLNFVPGDIRGVVVAAYYFMISFIGGNLSPPMIGWINDAFYAGEGLRYAMAIYPLIFGIPVILLAPLTLKLYRREIERMTVDSGEAKPSGAPT
jgi:MFS family permease